VLRDWQAKLRLPFRDAAVLSRSRIDRQESRSRDVDV